MPGRNYNAGSEYRYGFNGKDNDKDISEGGQDYGMRIYDSRLGRFLSEDPITKKYPELTPYQFSSNRVIDGIDQDGLEYFYYQANLIQKNGKVAFVLLNHWRTEEQVIVQMETIIGVKDFEIPRFYKKWVVNIGFFNYKFNSYAEMQKAADILKDPDAMNISNQCHCLPGFEIIGNTTEGEEVLGESIQSLGNSAAAGFYIGSGIKSMGGIKGALKSAYNLAKGAAKWKPKAERLTIFISRLTKAKGAKNQDEAIKLINSTLDKVEDEFSGVVKAKGTPKGDDGRMYGILDEKFITTLEDGTKIANTKGNRIILGKNGGIKIQTKDGTTTLFTKPGANE